MRIQALNTLTTETLSIALSLEEWMLEGGEWCDRSTAEAMVNLANDIKANIAAIKAEYANGLLIDWSAVGRVESIIRNVLSWIFPA
jgi:hypothetical protein